MVLSTSVLGLAALCLPVLVSCQTGEINSDTLLDLFGTTEVTELDPTRYIVRFSDTGSAKFRKRDGSLEAEGFFSVLAETAPEAKPVTTFDSELFHGASFDVKNSSAEVVTELLALPDVADVWPAALFTIPDAEATGVDKTSSAYTNWSPHRSTRVELAHARGHTGKGIVVGVVDSGVDYTHPALGAGFGSGFKIESGWDFVGDDYVVGGPYVPDADPMDCNGHGTHVSGIIASDDDTFGGVAPDVTLRAYKVFGCGGSTFEDVIIAAFLKAHEDGADIISASLGSNRGFPDAPLSIVSAAIQAEGTFVSIAAGNAGSSGPFLTSSGGNGVGVTTVGSVQRDDFPGYTVLAQSSGGETREIAYLSDNQFSFPVNGSLPGYIPENGREANTCPIFGNAPPARRDAVLIHPRNDCNWYLHGRPLIGRVDFAFFYNFENASWELPDREIYDSNQAKGFGLISFEDGDWLMSQIEAGHEITFDFDSEKAPVVVGDPGFEAGRMSWFSSWGPTLDARMKPEISAPGGDILSTWPVSGGSWAIHSGTSMATPYLTGIVALLFASRGGLAEMGPDAIPSTYRRLIASGKPVRHGFGAADLASISHQGAGLVDAIKAIEYTTTVNPAILHLNDTTNFVATQKFEVTNSGNEAVDYQLSHAPGSTIQTRPQSSAWIGTDPPLVTGSGNVAEAVISDETFTLQPGESRTITVTFIEPSDVNANMLPIYGGGIVVAGSHGEVVRVSYMGIKGSVYAQDIWEIERGVPVYFSAWLEGMVDGVQMPVKRGVTPQLYYNQLFSTREMSFDWVSRNWTEDDWQYPPVVGEKNFKGHFIGPPQGLSDTIPRFPMQNLIRSSLSTFYSDSIFAHGEEIPPGEYRLLGRVLRTYGDPQNIKDWQYRLSPWFNVTGELPDPPSTVSEAPPEPTVIPVRPCGHEGTPIKLTARVGDDQEVFGTYAYADFLAVDFTGLQTDPGHEFTSEGFVIRPNGNNILNSVYMSVHTNANSLLYFRPRSQVTGAWSMLDCEVRCEDKLRCASADVVPLYYTCERGQGLVRRAIEVPEGCERVRFTVEELQCPSASIVSVPVPEVTTV